MEKRFLGLLILFILILGIGQIIAIGEVENINHFTTVPRIVVKEGTTTNWAGYAVMTDIKYPRNLAVTEVNGSWIIPKVNCESKIKSYSSFWVGIDGYSSPTVEQIGTDSDCLGNSPVYYIWYEMYPKNPVYLNIRIYPGDKVFADVSYMDNDKFKLTIKDITRKTGYSTIQRLSGAKRSSAEWILEAPSSSNKVLPLPDFTSVYFFNTSVTVNGVTGTIQSPNYKNDIIDMVGRSGIIKAKTLNLGDRGSSFSVQWLHN